MTKLDIPKIRKKAGLRGNDNRLMTWYRGWQPDRVASSLSGWALGQRVILPSSPWHRYMRGEIGAQEAEVQSRGHEDVT